MRHGRVSAYDALSALFPNAFNLDVGAGKSAILSVIHDSFNGKTRQQRLNVVVPVLEAAGLVPVLVELYTPEEAVDRGITLIPGATEVGPASWDQAVAISESGSRSIDRKSSRRFRRVVFYSYKGGVGRTTALVHAAFHLARRGKRVVVIDMDVEAPGLHHVLPPSPERPIRAGLVDYLWERQTKAVDDSSLFETCLVDVLAGEKTEIAYTVEDAASRAQVHVIPAGRVDGEYVRRLGTLSYEEVLSRADDAWSVFEKELVEQFDPDLVLIDARTGLGEWGGLSLLRLADEVFLVLFPSEQNSEGVVFVKSLLEDVRDVTPHIVVSPIPEGAVGLRMLEHFLPKILSDNDSAAAVPIFYSPGIASATSLPLESAMANYARIANLISEAQVKDEIASSLERADRWKIVESLQFPHRDAKNFSASDYESYFQKTSDFDKFLDDARWVIRGRKGTGKSTLFHLFVEHSDHAVRRARGKLDGIEIFAGHGPVEGARFRPTTDEFGRIQRGIAKGKHDWLSFWRAYALVRLWVSNYGYLAKALGARQDTRPLREYLEANFDRVPSQPWRSASTSACLGLLEEPVAGLCRDVLVDMNAVLARENRKVWLLYDDLDQDINEGSDWQGEALGGLLRLAYDSNNRDLHNFRLKVLLREDIWSKLVFTNKSHFGEPRTVLLQWKSDDFLRLAYRLATSSSPAFRALVHRELPLAESDIDSASEEDLQVGLAPLWGLNQEKGKQALAAKWVYSRMTDSRENTYPRSLTVLLNAARDAELGSRAKAPPADRLLRPQSMQAGLKQASIERVNALKNEYPHLKPFLEDVQSKQSLRSQFKSTELETVWQRTSTSHFAKFEAFVAQLENAGLLARKRSRTYDYGFSSLYIDGLGVTRVQGEKK